MHESLADAVIELEIRIAYQDRTVAALDEIVRQLHARVDTLEAALRELRQANAAWIKKQQAAVAALDNRLGGSGGKVIWGTRFFGPWDPVEPVASVDSCKGIYWKAFGPPKIADGAVFVWEMSVDGSVCQTDFIQDRRIAAGGPFFTGAAGDCSAPLVTPGKHKVEVALYATRDQKTGRKNVDFGSDRITISNEIRSAKTKVVAGGSLACTSPEGLRVVASE